MNSQRILLWKKALANLYCKVKFVFNLLIDCLTTACRRPLSCVRSYIPFPYTVVGILIVLFLITKFGAPKRVSDIFAENWSDKKLPQYALHRMAASDFSPVGELKYPNKLQEIDITDKLEANTNESPIDEIQKDRKTPTVEMQRKKSEEAIDDLQEDHKKIIDEVQRKNSEETIDDIQKDHTNLTDKMQRNNYGKISDDAQEKYETNKKNVSITVGETKAMKQDIPITMTAPYHLDPNICPFKSLSYIAMIYSHPENFKNRITIRNTWGNKYRFSHGRIVFLLGKQDNVETQTRVEEEFKKYGDILQGNFHDHYKNLPLKGLMGFRWITENCTCAKAVIKTNDNIIFNLRIFHQRFLAYFDDYSHLIVGKIFENNTMPIIRDKKSKWYVPETEPLFSGRKQFPKYVSGLWVGLSMKLIQKLYLAAFNAPFFWIEDVYLFGMLPSGIKGITYVNIGQDIVDCDEMIQCYNNGTTRCPILMTACDFKNVKKVDLLWNSIDKQHLSPPMIEMITINGQTVRKLMFGV